MQYKNAVPYSKEFDDIYFDAFNPILERNSVYASAVDEIKNSHIVVAEVGFGFGLNFFCTALKVLKKNKTLHYIAAEKFPLNFDELKEFYANFPCFNELFSEFDYEILSNEYLRFTFKKGQILLDIYFGDALTWLDESEFKADIWYIDGFCPAKNKELWQGEFINKIASFCKENAILRSYSTARIFKDSLNLAGFSYTKIKGQNKKREFLHAVCKNPKASQIPKNAWFARGYLSKKPKNALIIGAGISGILTAFTLQQIGIETILIDELSSLQNGASSNLSGLMLPLIHKKDSLLGNFHLCAFLQAYNFYKKNEIFAPFVDFCSCYSYAKNEQEFSRFSQVNEKILSLQNDKIFIKKAAQILPLALREYLAKNLNIYFNTKFQHFKKDKNTYKIFCTNGKKFQADIIIFAGGASGNELIKSFDENILLSKVRGQTTHISPLSLDFALPLSAKGYICKANNEIQVIGSTFDRQNFSLQAKSSDDEKNLASVSEFLGVQKPKILGSNVGFRAYSGDRFIIAGLMHNINAFKDDYKALLWSKNKTNQPRPKYLDGIFINTAHGAHALSTAVLGASVISDIICSRQLCLSHKIFSEIHPARFLIRRLKKGNLK